MSPTPTSVHVPCIDHSGAPTVRPCYLCADFPWQPLGVVVHELASRLALPLCPGQLASLWKAPTSAPTTTAAPSPVKTFMRQQQQRQSQYAYTQTCAENDTQFRGPENRTGALVIVQNMCRACGLEWGVRVSPRPMLFACGLATPTT